MNDGAAGRIAAVIVAGGTGRRIGGAPKQFREVGGYPLLAWSLARFRTYDVIGPIVVVLPGDVAADPPTWLDVEHVRVTAGGESRDESVRRGLAVLEADEAAVVMIHDAARPFMSAAMLRRLAAAAAEGPVVPVLPLADTIKRMRTPPDVDRPSIESTLDRSRLRAVQTPQAFPLALIRRLHERAEAEGIPASDDAVLCERAGVEVRAVEGERWAWKITHPEDLVLAEWLVASGRVRWPGGTEP